jgi:uncharacterized protein YlzI (FlbEa/FlbD family)
MVGRPNAAHDNDVGSSPRRSAKAGGQAMIQLTDINGRTHAIHPDAIARLVEPGTSGKWHGVNCYVKTFDGDTIEVRESVSEIMGLIKSALEAKP